MGVGGGGWGSDERGSGLHLLFEHRKRLLECCFLSPLLLSLTTGKTGVGAGGWGNGWGEGGRQRWDTELFQTPLKVGGAHVSALQRALHVLLEEPPVCLQDFCRLLVQRVLGVRLLGGRGKS